MSDVRKIMTSSQYTIKYDVISANKYLLEKSFYGELFRKQNILDCDEFTIRKKKNQNNILYTEILLL